MKRYQIVRKVQNNLKKIASLQQANVELNRQHLLLSDKNQQYTESEETFGRGKSRETAVIGFINWKEYFLDEDTGEKIWLNRKHPVRKNGEWIQGY